MIQALAAVGAIGLLVILFLIVVGIFEFCSSYASALKRLATFECTLERIDKADGRLYERVRSLEVQLSKRSAQLQGLEDLLSVSLEKRGVKASDPAAKAFRATLDPKGWGSK